MHTHSHIHHTGCCTTRARGSFFPQAVRLHLNKRYILIFMNFVVINSCLYFFFEQEQKGAANKILLYNLVSHLVKICPAVMCVFTYLMLCSVSVGLFSDQRGCKSSSFPVAGSALDLCLQLKLFHSLSAELLKSGCSVFAYFILFMQVFTHKHAQSHPDGNTQEGNPLNSVLLFQHFCHCERLEANFPEGVFVSPCMCLYCVCVSVCVFAKMHLFH